MVEIKRNTNQQDFKIIHLHCENMNNFQSLKVVDHVSETQLKIG